MPDQKKGETSAYVEVDDREKAPNAEQKKWEEEHLALGKIRFEVAPSVAQLAVGSETSNGVKRFYFPLSHCG